MAEKMLVTQALDERDLLVKRLMRRLLHTKRDATKNPTDAFIGYMHQLRDESTTVREEYDISAALLLKMSQTKRFNKEKRLPD